MKIMPYAVLLTIIAILFPTSLRSEGILFAEDFSDATVGEPWNGYKQWQGSESPRIRAIPEKGKWGWFMDEPPGPAGMRVKLPAEYEIDGHAYRLSFKVRGTTARSFQVTLADAEQNRLGLQLGMNDSNIFQIAAVMIPPSDKRIFFTDGGYHSAERAPDGYSNGELYSATLNLNGTKQKLDFGGIDVPAQHGVLSFNAEGLGGAPAFSIVFELPLNFLRFSELRVDKASTTTARWAVGDFKLEEIKPH